MKRIEELAQGLLLLAKYDDKGFSTAAEHDIIYAGPSEEDAEYNDDNGTISGATTVSASEAKALLALGWHIDSETHSWAFFT